MRGRYLLTVLAMMAIAVPAEAADEPQESGLIAGLRGYGRPMMGSIGSAGNVRIVARRTVSPTEQDVYLIVAGVSPAQNGWYIEHCVRWDNGKWMCNPSENQLTFFTTD